VSGGADPDLYVDLDALTLLANQLGQIKASLEGAKEHIESLDRRLGSDRVIDAFDGFINGWKDGRKKIVEEVESIVDIVRGAVEGYHENEDRIIRAARSGS
jgi:archaellum component FlaC